MKQQVQTPESVPRLFDLVKMQDERLKLAFFSVLGNTVVAQNLDQVRPAFRELHIIFEMAALQFRMYLNISEYSKTYFT